MAKIRWGIISTARIGINRVIPAIQQAHNCEVTAICSRNIDTAKVAADKLNIPKAYGGYEDLINDPDIDAIYNPLPNHLHADWSIQCAEASKAVLCEKPLAIDADEAQKMVDVFKSRGVLLAEAFMYRFHPQTQYVRDLVAEGAIGTVRLIDAAFTFNIANENDIRLSKEMAGGGLMDVGCYCVNVMRFLTGEEPTGFAAQAQFGKTDVDETLVGTLQFPSGILGHFECSLRTPLKQVYEIRGTEGRIRVENAFVIPSTESTNIQVWRGDKYEEINILPADEYQLMAEDFADSLLNNRPPLFAPEDAVQNMRAIDQLLASARDHAG